MDNFKAINDNYGHIAGDRTLKMFAETLEEYCDTEKDILCRIGGDEFVVFVRSAHSKSELSNLAGDVLADLCRKLDECKFDTHSLHCNCKKIICTTINSRRTYYMVSVSTKVKD